MKNEVVLDFCIWEFDDITHEELTHKIGVEPVKVWVKGQPVNPKMPARLAKKNGWRMSSGLDKYSTFEDQMDSLLTILEGKLDVFKSICDKYYCEFSCALTVYAGNGESTPWVHLNSRYNKLIKELNIEFDLDLYCWPNNDNV
jgi:hypothetical protein